jgi:hypothetical protein
VVNVTQLMNEPRNYSHPMSSAANSIWKFMSVLTAIKPLTILEIQEGYCCLRDPQSLNAQILGFKSGDCVIRTNCSPQSHLVSTGCGCLMCSFSKVRSLHHWL